MIKMFVLLFVLFPRLTQTTIPLADASKHVGEIIKINCQRYQTTDNGRTLTFRLDAKNPAKALVISLNGRGRKRILTEMQARREINRQVASPLDTSLTASGKIIIVNGRLTMVVSRPADIYLGADLQIERH